MRLLILGGTVFLGRATAAHAASRGHEVICAARGVSGPVPPGVMLVPVDRDRPDGLAPLDGQTFDAVIEVGRVPSHVRRAVRSEEHTSELQSHHDLVCRLLLEKKKKKKPTQPQKKKKTK